MSNGPRGKEPSRSLCAASSRWTARALSPPRTSPAPARERSCWFIANQRQHRTCPTHCATYCTRTCTSRRNPPLLNQYGRLVLLCTPTEPVPPCNVKAGQGHAFSGSGFRIPGSGLRIQGSVSRVGSRIRVSGFASRVLGGGLRVPGLACRVSGIGLMRV